MKKQYMKPSTQQMLVEAQPMMAAVSGEFTLDSSVTIDDASEIEAKPTGSHYDVWK
ncbi:MAG: hypothetical protein MR649_04330 [Prevotella sp.]|nr:hypothetical protein [Prevotella sp.]